MGKVRAFSLVFLSLLIIHFALTRPSKDEIGTWCAAYDSGISREEMVQRYADTQYDGDIREAKGASNIAIATRCPEHKDKLFSFDEIREFTYSWEERK